MVILFVVGVKAWLNNRKVAQRQQFQIKMAEINAQTQAQKFRAMNTTTDNIAIIPPTSKPS